MSKELAKFEDWPLKTPRIKPIIKKVNALTNEFKAAQSGEEAYKIYKKMSRLNDKVSDDFTHISVLFSLDTTNESYKKAMKIINEGGPEVNVANIEFEKAFVESPYRSFLEDKLGSFIFKMYENALKGFDDRVVKEAQKENELVMDYQGVIASFKIPFRGATYNLPQMGKFLKDNDRETRKEASEAT